MAGGVVSWDSGVESRAAGSLRLSEMGRGVGAGAGCGDCAGFTCGGGRARLSLRWRRGKGRACEHAEQARDNICVTLVKGSILRSQPLVFELLAQEIVSVRRAVDPGGDDPFFCREVDCQVLAQCFVGPISCRFYSGPHIVAVRVNMIEIAAGEHVFGFGISRSYQLLRCCQLRDCPSLAFRIDPGRQAYGIDICGVSLGRAVPSPKTAGRDYEYQ